VTRLLVLAEGDSEELFVRELLAPHLIRFGIYASATVVRTKRLANGTTYAGGNRWGKVCNSLRPLLAVHEFEAWYFADPGQVEKFYGQPGIAQWMRQASETAGGPESINQGKETHPSKRLEGYGIGFRKTAGVAVLKEIGIPAIRAACPHFACWLGRLEALGRDT